DDPQHYLFASTEIDANREYTFCWQRACNSGSTLDHIVVSNELFTHLVDLRAYRMHSVLDTYPNFINEASDHIPVYASFRFPTSTAIESVSEAPKQLQIQSIFPNPATDLITVNYRATNASSRAVQVHIIDVLGRQITVPITTSSSGGRIQINTSGLSPGLYVIRISDGQHVASSRFVKGL
ncbi:MAG: T9SS type A sorting domain-containing protein, partial [Bacteroidetes bacterium]